MLPPLAKKIGQKFAGLSKSEQAVATYLTTHLRELPFLTAAKIATNAGVSQMTVSRCLRSIGYAGLEDVKRELNRSFHQMPWLIGEATAPSPPSALSTRVRPSLGQPTSAIRMRLFGKACFTRL